MRCPACEQSELRVFVTLGEVPVRCHILAPTYAEAVHGPTRPIDLGVCPNCAMVYNVSFEPEVVDYDNYENSLAFSGRFQQFAAELVAHLVERYDLHQKRIVEIGCGRGEFLREICRAGDSSGVGYDPGFAGDLDQSEDLPRLSIRNAHYTAETAVPADFLCCRQTLEHMPEPRRFLEELARSIGAEPTSLYFEVPNFARTLDGRGFWDIIYEHCLHFTGPAMARLFQESGFSVRDLSTAYDDQFLCIEAARQPWHGASSDIQVGVDRVLHLADRFQHSLVAEIQLWDGRITKWLREGKRVVGWGGGSKGVMFYNMVPACRGIEYMVDLNPYKQGKYVQGSGQQFVAPQFLAGYRPDVIILMNPIYQAEIQQMARGLGVEAQFVVASA